MLYIASQLAWLALVHLHLGYHVDDKVPQGRLDDKLQVCATPCTVVNYVVVDWYLQRVTLKQLVCRQFQKPARVCFTHKGTPTSQSSMQCVFDTLSTNAKPVGARTCQDGCPAAAGNKSWFSFSLEGDRFSISSALTAEVIPESNKVLPRMNGVLFVQSLSARRSRG